MQARSEKIAEEEDKCRVMAENAQHDLDEALPALAEATKALESLNKKDMTEIKSYAKPPALVEKVMEAVMILRGGEPTWAEAKRQLGECILDDTMVYTPFLFLYNSLSIFELSLHRSYFLGCFRLEMFLRMFLNFNDGNPATSELHIDLKTGSSL